MKVDLNELKRKAQAASGDLWAQRAANVSDVAHIAANSPAVTMALIARIRELEGVLSLCERALDRVEAGCPASREIAALLEKGAVLP